MYKLIFLALFMVFLTLINGTPYGRIDDKSFLRGTNEHFHSDDCGFGSRKSYLPLDNLLNERNQVPYDFKLQMSKKTPIDSPVNDDNIDSKLSNNDFVDNDLDKDDPNSEDEKTLNHSIEEELDLEDYSFDNNEKASLIK